MAARVHRRILGVRRTREDADHIPACVDGDRGVVIVDARFTVGNLLGQRERRGIDLREMETGPDGRTSGWRAARISAHPERAVAKGQIVQSRVVRHDADASGLDRIRWNDERSLQRQRLRRH